MPVNPTPAKMAQPTPRENSPHRLQTEQNKRDKWEAVTLAGAICKTCSLPNTALMWKCRLCPWQICSRCTKKRAELPDLTDGTSSKYQVYDLTHICQMRQVLDSTTLPRASGETCLQPTREQNTKTLARDQPRAPVKTRKPRQKKDNGDFVTSTTAQSNASSGSMVVPERSTTQHNIVTSDHSVIRTSTNIAMSSRAWPQNQQYGRPVQAQGVNLFRQYPPVNEALNPYSGHFLRLNLNPRGPTILLVEVTYSNPQAFYDWQSIVGYSHEITQRHVYLYDDVANADNRDNSRAPIVMQNYHNWNMCVLSPFHSDYMLKLE
jgi:hypothetical protein